MMVEGVVAMDGSGYIPLIGKRIFGPSYYNSYHRLSGYSGLQSMPISSINEI